MKEVSFSTLWGSEWARATRASRPYADDAAAMRARDAYARDLRAAGYSVKRTTLRGQMRPYWGFGDDCGEVCTVYSVLILSEPAQVA